MGTINLEAAATKLPIIDGTNPPRDLRDLWGLWDLRDLRDLWDLRDTSLRYAALIRAAHAAFNARVARRAILSWTLRDAVFDLRVGHRGALRDLRSPPDIVIAGRTIELDTPNKSRPALTEDKTELGLK